MPVVAPFIHRRFTYESMDELEAIAAAAREGYVYPRYGSPTLAAFEAAVAELEEAKRPLHSLPAWRRCTFRCWQPAFAPARPSSPRSISMARRLCCSAPLAELGAQARFVDVTDLAAVQAALAETRPVALVAETISNR